MAFVNYSDIWREFNEAYNYGIMNNVYKTKDYNDIVSDFMSDKTDKYRNEVLKKMCDSIRDKFSEKICYKIPKPVKIHEGISHKTGKTVTVVFWEDGTKTKVSNMEQDKPDRYMAFCAALAKKVYGSTDKAQKTVEKLLVKE